jgi:multidrug resistance efflux pump
MYAGQQNFGMLKVGQEVIVKLPSYPFQEFGTVRGHITSIADFSRDSTFLVNVQFPDGL